MNHWLLDKLERRRGNALRSAEHIQVFSEILGQKYDADLHSIRDTAVSLEVATLDFIMDRVHEQHDPHQLTCLRKCAGDAFRLFRVLPALSNPMKEAINLLHMSALAVIADKGSDAARMLRERQWDGIPLESECWMDRTWATIVDVWLRLIRKKGWQDRDLVLERVSQLRAAQNEFEERYLNEQEPATAQASALELIGLYHLARAAEVLALFITDGVVDENYQVQNVLDMHFDRALEVCEHLSMIELEPLIHLLQACSSQMIRNSIWTVTRAVNSRVTRFVQSLVERGRGDKAIFDVLPPQRQTLAEEGLLGSSRRAIVVSLPTSSGKTLIAQFRILQALNQFNEEEGWIAYVVPTRTLVNQVVRRLRMDFRSFDPPIVVEQVSPALEISSIENDILGEMQVNHKFRILVTTPEKLDLIIRQGVERKIGRPLTLVIVDEAHNLQSPKRGLKLELLLATINKECELAQFLLLTPFIPNGSEIAKWLGGQSSDDISLSLDWQPNDRIIGVISPSKGEMIAYRSYDYTLEFESVHTYRQTIAVDDVLPFPKCKGIARTFSQIANSAAVAATTAQYLANRGPIIVMHAKPDWVWPLASKLKIEKNRFSVIHEDVQLVQEYVRLELGKDFPLVELLEFGIGVHHAGLPDEIRSLMEWLFENDRLRFLVATTTIAQGVNFPVSGVVMASHQYFGTSGAVDMPPEDFWNIAGRAGRIDQGQLGVIALAAHNDEKRQRLNNFIKKQTEDLNSALIQMVLEAGSSVKDLGGIVSKNPEWSSFLQYLTHTYLQMGKPDTFVDQIEQVLRGTFGFAKLRASNRQLANELLSGIELYTRYLQKPQQPLSLVDSTGFSLQSIKTVLFHKGNLDQNSWDSDALFDPASTTLKEMMGVLIRVPELRENLDAILGSGISTDGNLLASIIKDWVNGVSVVTIAQRYFSKLNSEDDITALTKCGQNLFGKLTQTSSWGLGALLAITAGGLPEDEFRKVANLPSQVYYGVNSDDAILMRVLGVPREASTPLATALQGELEGPLPDIRERLLKLDLDAWQNALGLSGRVYRRVWRVLQGLE